MRQAFRLARRAWPSPNPRVGCVIVREGHVVGRGWHHMAGQAHAEVNALLDAGELARGATAYVSLEPCCHTGRTGPCTEALIAAGVSRVVAGCVDPNPAVAGKGIARLRAAGVDTSAGVLRQEAERLIAGHAKYVTLGLPHVVWKYAMTFDGRIATATGRSRWITGEASRREVHRMRRDSDAVIVGIGTALADDPQLNVRAVPPAHQPLRVVMDSQARLPVASALFSSEGGKVLVFVSAHAPRERGGALQEVGATVVVAGEDRTDLAGALRTLADDFGVREVLLECGPELSSSAIQAGLVDEAVCFLGAKLFGGQAAPGPLGGQGVTDPADAATVSVWRVRRFGEDLAVWMDLQASSR